MRPQLQRARQNLKETKEEVYIQTATLMNGAFALVAALAWNDAVKALIVRYVPTGSALYSLFIYAIALTVLVVLISMRMNKLIRRYRPEEEAKE